MDGWWGFGALRPGGMVGGSWWRGSLAPVMRAQGKRPWAWRGVEEGGRWGGGEVADGVGCCGDSEGRRGASRIMVFAWEKDVYVHGMAVGASRDARPAGAF